MTKFLITQVGFNDTCRYVATVITATSILAILIARPNPEHQIRKPEKWHPRVFIDPHAFQNASFAWFTASICFLFFGFYAVFFNLEEWAAAEGLGYKGQAPNPQIDLGEYEVPKDAIRTFWLLSIMNASSTVGRVGSAYLCDLFGALNVHAFVTLIASLLVLTLWTLTHTLNSAIAFVILFGIFSGSVIGLPPASVAYILGPDPAAQAKLGQWTGMMYSSAALFALTGPVIAGHLISSYGQNYLTVQLWSGACMLVSAGCMGMAVVYTKRSRARMWLSRKVSSSVSSSRNMLRSFATNEKDDSAV